MKRYERALHTALMGSYHKPIPSQDNSLQDLDPSNFGYRFVPTGGITQQRSERLLYTTTEINDNVSYGQGYDALSDTATCCTQWDRNSHTPISNFSNLGHIVLDDVEISSEEQKNEANYIDEIFDNPMISDGLKGSIEKYLGN